MFVKPRPPAPAATDYESIVRKHQASLWRYMRFLGAEADQAEDLVQETFIAAFRGGFQERHPRATATYLRRVARHRFLNAVRARRARPALESLEEGTAAWTRWQGADGGETRREALRHCLGRLRLRARRAVDLAYREGHSRRDIAITLEMTGDGVKTLLRRAREALRACVERELAS